MSDPKRRAVVPDEVSPPGPHAGWWHERSAIGLATVLDARRVRHWRTPRHEIELLSHDRLGWALALDGLLLHVEQDPAPREMLAHVPLVGRAHAAARVLIVGGGDGCVLHEVLKHAVAQVDVVEPEPALRELPPLLGLAAAVSDARVAFHDALPPGPRWDVVLLARPLLPISALGPRLCAGGVIAEWDVAVLGREQRRWLRRGAPAERLAHEQRYVAACALAQGGLLGFSLHTDGAASHAEPQRDFEADHYNADLHRAAFALPACWSELR